MSFPKDIVFRGCDRSDALTQRIEDEIQGLERYHERITHCRVVVEQPHKPHQRGNLFEVLVDLRVPGQQIIVRKGGKDSEYEDAYIAVRDAFNAVERKLAERENWSRL